MEGRKEYQKFFNEKIRTVIEDMTVDILKIKPQMPMQFMVDWLDRKIKEKTLTYEEKECLQKSDIMNEDELQKMEAKKRVSKNPRSSISAQAFGKINKIKQFIPKAVQKQKVQRQNLKRILKNCFMFQSLNERNLEEVVGCMKKIVFDAGQYIIKQGDRGNELYVVSKGELSCTKKFNPHDQETFLKRYITGDSFGQLALLYNVPRQASIYATEYSELWELDRETFNNIVRDAVIRNKNQVKQFLLKVQIFRNMEASQIQKLVDSVKINEFEEDQYVCKEGDEGDCLYIVEEGQLVAQKLIQGTIKKVFQYKQGSYFGEVSLLYDVQRKASIKCLRKTVLLSIGKNQFKRLIGVDQKLLYDFKKYQGLSISN